MYSLLLGLQILAVILGFVCVILLMTQKSSSSTKLLLVTCLCSFIQNFGYFMEMRSKNVDEAMMAIRFEYIGTSFIVTLLMLFVFKYCRVKLSKWLIHFVVAFDILVLVSVWCSDFMPIYYKAYTFVDNGIMPHVVITKGILYIAYSVVLYCEFILSAVISLMAMFKADDANMRKNYWLLFLSCCVPCLFYVSGIINLIDGYDPAPLGGTAGIMIFGLAIIVRRVFDVVETAHENILMDLDDAIIILDYRRGFQEANKAAIALFPELASTQFGQLVPNATFNDLIDKKPQDDVEIDGRFYKVHVNELYGKSGIDSNFIGYSLVLFDVTEAKEQYLKMSELKSAADSANMAKSSFLANVSHEIRTPINVVVGMSDVILRDYEEPMLLSYAQNIKNAATTLLELINDILDFSKIESGRVYLSNDNYRVDEFFRDIILVFEHKGAEKNLTFTTGIASDIPAVLYGDQIRIKQIVTNILSNAFKYTREGGVTLKAAFEKVGVDRGNLILSIEDTGIGIRKEELGKIFELFVRLDERLNRSVEGTGLGLNITKKLVEQMGGEIKVYSEYGKGSTFTVIIPQVIRSRESEVIGQISDSMNYVPERKGIGYIAPNAQVLVIDDSRTNLIVAKALLRDTQVNVTTGSSGEECIDLVRKKHFDVIILDHRMPGMDGVETLHRLNTIKHMSEGAPVIMLTANAVSNARDFYLKEGFADFISKPISEESITTMLRKYIPKELIKEV